MAWYNFRKSAPQQKNAYSLDSPALLDMMLRADKPGLSACRPKRRCACQLSIPA